MKKSTKTAVRLIVATVTSALILSPTVARGDVVLDWNSIMQTTVAGQPPFPQARFAAITQLAVFEAVNAITGDYKPYLGTVTAPASASAEAAAVAAAHTVLKTYFPGSAASLDAEVPNSPSGAKLSFTKCSGEDGLGTPRQSVQAEAPFGIRSKPRVRGGLI